MDDATICFPRRGDEVLLIDKKRGLGDGLYNGPGGTIEAGETPVECAIRETREEVGLRVDDPEHVGAFVFALGEEERRCHVFVADSFARTPTETAEARPEWHPIDDLPVDRMWEADRLWVPRVLAGETVAGRIAYDADGDELLAVDLEWGEEA
ncbi:8-oxo-dGTP diphosphatase [Halobacteriales archaeon SW_7_68_16]|nr:MAG: 8-oxo-dGTP diphosphatase [Halobacteriales archaeon SW_7_68_16]